MDDARNDHVAAQLDPGELWRLSGCIAESYSLDIARHSFGMLVRCPVGTTPYAYQIELRGVWSWKYERPLSTSDQEEEPWDYVEVSEIEADRVQSGDHTYWQVKMDMWLSHLEVMCRELRISRID